MVDATIKMVINRLVPIIEKKVRDEVNLVLNSAEEAASLASKLKKIQEVLEDAERRSITDHKVEAWLDKIKEAAYEMEDVLDEWEAKLAEMESEACEDAISDNFIEKVSSFIQSLCLCFKQTRERHGIALTIKQLNGRLESIDKEIDDEFKFFKNAPKEKERDSREIKRFLTTSFFDVKDVSEIKGRDREKKNIVSRLLSMRSIDDDHLQIVSVVGTGGLGKTTLARLVFNDSKVTEYFEKTIWVCVSDPFDEIRVANSILKQLVDEDSQYENDLQVLLKKIQTSVDEERILLVLDDVWEHDEGKWNQLRNCFNKAAIGSRIFVTTRNERVAKSMGTSTVDIIPLRLLSNAECWSLLSEIAFMGEGKEDPKKREIGWEIVKRCKGLPLAAKTLGSLLHTKHSVQEWKNVLESKIWELEKVQVDLFPHLYLSYNELRPAVKRCFTYCATFPKDTKIVVDNMIKMLMAQGFLYGGSGDEMELQGRKYVEDLAVRFFFQDLEKDPLGAIKSCKMHDVVHDFAQFLTKNECLVVESLDDVRKLGSSLRNTRHLTWFVGGKSSNPGLMCSIEKLRSFRCKNSLPMHILGTLKRVRELSLRHCTLKELSPDIGNLVHLRYLDLGHNPLRILPKSMCYLYHLQTLSLDLCSNLSKLPEEIHKLRKLRHLVVKSKVSFPEGLGKLTCLRTLATFRASRGGNKFRYLKNLKQLEILGMVIDNLSEKVDAIEASKAELKNKNGLQGLRLKLRGEVSLDVMEALEPPPDLTLLVLKGYVGFVFPHWIATSLHNLNILYVVSCSFLPPLATLQSLKELYIYSVGEMEYLGHEFLGVTVRPIRQLDGGRAVAFPKLKKLVFLDCEKWTTWADIGEEKGGEEDILDSVNIMPCLRELQVMFCPNLKSLPHRLLSRTPLEHLNIDTSHTIIKQCKSEGGFKFLSPTCKVTTMGSF